MSDDVFLAIVVGLAVLLFVGFVLLWIRADADYERSRNGSGGRS